MVRPNPAGATVLALEIAVDETVDDLVELARLVRVKPGARDSLTGVGVAIVGVVRRSDGFVRMAPNLGWHDVALGERLIGGLKIDLPISVANEADLGALAEQRRGAAVGANHVLFISGEVGVGGGLIVDGRPLIGLAGYGGEVGHIPTPSARTSPYQSVGPDLRNAQLRRPSSTTCPGMTPRARSGS